MITITIHRKNDFILGVKLSGHARFADYGKDIVCAGVSSILTTTVNAILRFNEKAIQIEDQGNFILNVLENDEITQTLLENMICEFQELEESYPKNVKLKEDIETC